MENKTKQNRVKGNRLYIQTAVLKINIEHQKKLQCAATRTLSWKL